MYMSFFYTIKQDIHDSRAVRGLVEPYTFTTAEFRSFMDPKAPGYWAKENQAAVSEYELGMMAEIAKATI